LRWYSLILIILQLAFGITFYGGPAVTAEEGKILTQAIIEYTNKARESKDLSILTENEKLDEAALAKANDMIQKNYWDHNSPDGKNPWTFIDNTGYTYSYAGENLARGFDNAQGVFEAWMVSPTHRDNILHKSYQDIGVAVASGILEGRTTTVIVQLFATSKEVTSAALGPNGNSVMGAVLAASPQTIPQINLSNPLTTPSKLPIFIFWGIIVSLLIVDGVLLKKAGIFHQHRFHFHTSLVLNIILLGFLVFGVARIM